MAVTSADLDALDQAALTLATSGIASVTIGGQTVAVKSLEELREFRRDLDKQLALGSGKLPIAFAQFVTGADR